MQRGDTARMAGAPGFQQIQGFCAAHFAHENAIRAMTQRGAQEIGEVVRLPPGASSLTLDVEGDYIAQLIVHDGFTSSTPDTVRVQAVAPSVVTIAATDDEAALTWSSPPTLVPLLEKSCASPWPR